jgi:hypothetical protein
MHWWGYACEALFVQAGHMITGVLAPIRVLAG